MGYSAGSPSFEITIMIITQLLQVLFPLTFAVDPDCNFSQMMVPDISYYVYNNGYPGYYPPGQQCRWLATAPVQYRIQADCNIEMPQSPNCSQDRLLISLTGDPNLSKPDTYCGFGNISVTTQLNNISIGLITASNSVGGRFLCKLQAIREPDCDCGYKYIRRIVGGTETGVNEYPMMVGIVDLGSREIYCGGTIISSTYVVSAAQCVINRSTNQIGVIVGEHDTTTGSDSNATKIFRINNTAIHPAYVQNDPYANDIAVVQIIGIIQFNQQVGPVCLPFRYYTDTFAGNSVEILGWGLIEFAGLKSTVLLKTDVNVLSEMNCSTEVGGSMNQICTYKDNHDSCQGDSGGPLLWTAPTKRIQLVGVISQGDGCASGEPAINTRVTSYVGWILSVTPDAAYCVK